MLVFSYAVSRFPQRPKNILVVTQGILLENATHSTMTFTERTERFRDLVKNFLLVLRNC